MYRGTYCESKVSGCIIFLPIWSDMLVKAMIMVDTIFLRDRDNSNGDLHIDNFENLQFNVFVRTMKWNNITDVL